MAQQGHTSMHLQTDCRRRFECSYAEKQVQVFENLGLNELGRRLLGFTGARCSVLIIGSHKGRKAITLCNLGPF